jgi:hypothetical protein
MSGDFKLEPHEFNTAVWARVRAYYEKRIAALRTQNDNTQLTAEETAVIRGRIAEVRGLLALGRQEDSREGSRGTAAAR